MKGSSDESPFPKTLSVQNGDVTDGASIRLPPLFRSAVPSDTSSEGTTLPVFQLPVSNSAKQSPTGYHPTLSLEQSPLHARMLPSLSSAYPPPRIKEIFLCKHGRLKMRLRTWNSTVAKTVLWGAECVDMPDAQLRRLVGKKRIAVDVVEVIYSLCFWRGVAGWPGWVSRGGLLGFCGGGGHCFVATGYVHI